MSLLYMLGVCYALMVGTLVYEYVQLTYLFYPTENTGMTALCKIYYTPTFAYHYYCVNSTD